MSVALCTWSFLAASALVRSPASMARTTRSIMATVDELRFYFAADDTSLSSGPSPPSPRRIQCRPARLKVMSTVGLPFESVPRPALEISTAGPCFACQIV